MCGRRDICLKVLRELSRTLSKLAQLHAPPKASTIISGSGRKKFAAVRTAVGHFVGDDVMRALIGIDEYDTVENIHQLKYIAGAAYNLQFNSTPSPAP